MGNGAIKIQTNSESEAAQGIIEFNCLPGGSYIKSINVDILIKDKLISEI